MKSVTTLLLASVLIAGCIGDDPISIETAQLVSVRDRYLALEMKIVGPVRSLGPSDGITLTAVLEREGKDPFVFEKNGVTGLELGDSVILTGAPSLDSNDYSGLKVTLEKSGKVISSYPKE